MRSDAGGTVATGPGVCRSRRRDDEEITFDGLQKFWHDLAPQARRGLLRLEKQALMEHARTSRSSHCSRCNGLLLDCFARIRQEEEQDPSSSSAGHHSWGRWGGLSVATTKDYDTLTLADCFAESPLRPLQNVFDHARARERERRTRHPDACGAGGRRGFHGISREKCALHTARPSCDTLEEFWSPLGEGTRSRLLRMREEDFIDKLTRRFDRKKFCRDCRKNVMREFKELKEPRRTTLVSRERRCSCWFCVDNGFQCEVFEDGITVDWSQCLSSSEADDGCVHRFEWAVGTAEGESDISGGFEDVGMNARVHKTGIDLAPFQDYFVTLRAWRSDDTCTQYCVKAHVLKGGDGGESCALRLQHKLVVSDGFVAVTADGESMRGFFGRAQKVEEQDEDAAMDLDSDGSHTQKHAKSPELAREFLLDSASVIFKEQVVKAFRDGTAQENARGVFVSLALELLEERVHVACKELITLEKQNKLLEEEEKEMRKEQERRTKRKMKEREKKQRQKQKLKEKGKDNGTKKLVESKSPDDMSSPALNNSSTSTNHESADTPCSRDAANAYVVDLHSPGRVIDQSSCRENKVGHCNGVIELSPTDSSDCCQEEPAGRIGDSQWQSVGRKPRARSARGCSSVVPKGGHIGSAGKNTVPNQVWQPLDARNKSGLCITGNARGHQKLSARCNEALLLVSENSSDLYKPGIDQACENGGRVQTAYGDATHMLSNQDCYSAHEGYWYEDRMTNSDDSSGSLSSCMGEGDRESSSSSVTIWSEQNPSESSEGCPDSTVNNLDTLLLRIQNPDLGASPSLLETCARKGFREYRPETARLTHNDRLGLNIVFQGQHLHHQSMDLHPNSSPTKRLHNHCWASPTDHNFQNAISQVPYSKVNAPLFLVHHQQFHKHPEPIQKTAASFSAMPLLKWITDHSLTDLNPGRFSSDKLKPLGQKDLPEDNGKTEDAAFGSFSLFQYSLPIASPVPASSEDDKEFADRTPLAQGRAHQLCSRDQIDVKEYKLFSTKDTGMFSFMQIK